MDSGHAPESSRAGAQAFNLTSTTMQNQIHELAKTLPPPRKQNTACDACRARKVKCNQLPGQDKCQHCLSKNYPCTHFVQAATTEKKRTAAASRRPRALSSTTQTPTASSSLGPAASEQPTPGHAPTSPNYPNTTALRPTQTYWPQYHPVTSHTSTRDLLAYLFSPPVPSSTYHSSAGLPGAYADWGGTAPRLAEEAFRFEVALDLVEVYFQIVHTRLPLLNPAQFRARLHFSLHLASQSRSHSPHTPPSASSTSTFLSKGGLTQNDAHKPLHPALVATVIAWGAKFSEHPLLLADRAHNGNQSHIAKTLINRARDLAEDLKVHRIPTADHVVIALLIEPMQNQNMDAADGYHGFWLMSAIRLLLDLQINHKSVMSNIQDPEDRGTMIFAWWMACLADAYRSVYYRRKPMLDDDDYDIDFYTVGPVAPEHLETQGTQPSPREQLEFLGYYRASHALARISRQMSRQLWRPATESDGIPFDILNNFMNLLNDWREEYLHHVGVPNNFDSGWDFVSAVTACECFFLAFRTGGASDATYHIMWIVLFNAVDDFGIREINDLERTGSPGHLHPKAMEIEGQKQKVLDTALASATRIAGLAGILTQNGYLKLDSAVMHVSIIQAGILLARLGRPEVKNCIDGLEQYSYAYEECAEQAAEMRKMYAQAVAGEVDLAHMMSVYSRSGGGMGPASNAMAVDPPMFGGYVG
ncbi:uncharacterized protein C8Q71DRAFT_854180 [Rhodofomes roseus]|uniref:Zn(2)-C6 fungal-type domain-containing protein n=1 Tax=Rhodofomes roseus TaxID=34475 RepID=A0ABQ8KSS8_9APHY|nr:uncharacterized protein C8Q71DRAFT_854180 [Rhodofomes roseus]KAH9841824.1 hypothetical protein C8Q71DRAFT_854180 [Rhodofomes roseus]